MNKKYFVWFAVAITMMILISGIVVNAQGTHPRNHDILELTGLTLEEFQDALANGATVPELIEANGGQVPEYFSHRSTSILSVTGLTEAELKEALSNGITIPELIEANGNDLTDYFGSRRDALLSAIGLTEEELQEALSSGATIPELIEANGENPANFWPDSRGGNPYHSSTRQWNNSQPRNFQGGQRPTGRGGR